MTYKEEILKQFWKYQEIKYPDYNQYFEGTQNDKNRPPVLYKHTEGLNVITHSKATKSEIISLQGLVPKCERHKWFRSFNSSQALVQNIFGNLKVYGKLDYLNEITDEEYDEPLLSGKSPNPSDFLFEVKSNYLKESNPTSLDAFLRGNYQIAIECKFTEKEVGNCSMPITKDQVDSDFCNGSYTFQNNRSTRCSLSEKRIEYWNHIPKLFNWNDNLDYSPCPLDSTYQLVRNILTACVKSDGIVSQDNGHALLIYDERNPQFQAGGKGYEAYVATKRSLKNEKLLRKCSWQRILNHLGEKKELDWLTEEVNLKYGL